MIILFGLPGAGKGTQAELLATHYKFSNLSMGALLRTAAQSDLEIAQIQDRGQLVPLDHIVKYLLPELKRLDLQKTILDGFPREPNQARWLIDWLATESQTERICIELVIDEAESQRRLIKRARHDDTPEVITYRIQQYADEVLPALAVLHGSGGVKYQVNGQADRSQVQANLIELLDKHNRELHANSN